MRLRGERHSEREREKKRGPRRVGNGALFFCLSRRALIGPLARLHAVRGFDNRKTRIGDFENDSLVSHVNSDLTSSWPKLENIQSTLSIRF